MTGVIGVSRAPVSKPRRVELGLEAPRVRPEPLDQLRLLLEDPDRLAAGGRDGRRVRGGEEERAGALDEDVAQGLRAGDVAAQDADGLATACRPGSRPGRGARSGRRVPRPFRPSTPDAWASSTKTATSSYSSAASTISGSGAMSPSMLKTPSVTTRISRYGADRPAGPWRGPRARSSRRAVDVLVRDRPCGAPWTGACRR